MMVVVVAVTAGLLVGGGTVAAVWGIRPPLAPLDRRVAAVLSDPAHRPVPARPWQAWRDRLVAATPDQIVADLSLLGRRPDGFAVTRLGWAAAGLAIATILAVLVGVTPVWLPVVAAAGASAGWYLAAYEIRDAATKRRRTLALALAAWTQMAAMLIRAGLGVDQALRHAAEAGSHWTFDLLQSATRRATDQRLALWQTLADLGDDTDMAELRQLAAELRLTDSVGGSPADALFTRAEAMRAQELSDAMTAAHKAEVKQSGPLALLAICFVAFLLYPALQTFLGS